MDDKKFQAMLDEAVTAAKEYPHFYALGAAQGSEIWACLSPKQRRQVQESLAHGVIGNTSHSGCEDV
jgi:hypothetical protein